MWFDQGVQNPECDVHDIQGVAVQSARDGDIFVEVGTFLGESLHCLINKRVAAQKSLKIFCVDNFDLTFMNQETAECGYDLNAVPSLGESREKEILKLGHKGLLVEFFRRLREAGKEQYLTGCLVGKSWDLAQAFADHSVYFCFIDAGHSYQAVSADLESWYPKMRLDGFFCGHDWNGEGVRKAVMEFAVRYKCPKIQLFQSSWRLFFPTP